MSYLRPLRQAFVARAFAAAIFLIAGALPKAAHADGLLPGEVARLANGQTVVREQTIETDSRRFVGGVTYTILDTTPAELAVVLEDVSAYYKLLPRTKSARRVAPPADSPTESNEFFIELRQGNAVIDACYTMRVRPDPAAGIVRFWLDPERPHAVDDAWGYFKYEVLPSPTPAGRLLLTYGVLMDMGPGIARELFEGKIRALVLSVPQNVRGYLAGRKPRDQRASL